MSLWKKETKRPVFGRCLFHCEVFTALLFKLVSLKTGLLENKVEFALGFLIGKETKEKDIFFNFLNIF